MRFVAIMESGHMNNKSVLHYDEENNILYFVIREGEEHHFTELSEDITIEFDEHDEPPGLEIFNASKVLVTAIGRERLTLALA